MKKHRILLRVAPVSAALALAWLLPASCAGTGAATRSAPAPQASEQRLSGAEIWGETCSRCHNHRPADWLTDAGWDVAMFHMGAKANLTHDEREAVLRFLQDGN